MTANETKINHSEREKQYMESFTGMLTLMFMLYDKAETPDQLSRHSAEYLEVFESISNQPYEIMMTCFRCVIVGMSLEDFKKMISGTISKETIEKNYEQLLRSHFTNTEEESRMNAQMDLLIRQAEDSLDRYRKLQETHTEMKKDKETIIQLKEEKIDQYKAMATEYKARLDKIQQKQPDDPAEADEPKKRTGFFRKKARKTPSGPNSEMIRFRKEFAENEEYEEVQRDFLTMCFGEPDSKKRLSYEEIVMIASPKMSVNQMQVLRDRILWEREET